MANNYSNTASATLLDVFNKIAEELGPLTQRVLTTSYPTEEGRVADAIRMYELAGATAAVLKTRLLLQGKRI